MEAIKICGLSKMYKDNTQGLRGLTLSVRQGEVFALLGPNGAGKSTLINILTTFLKPTSGEVTVLGHDLIKEAGMIRRKIAYVAQKISIDDHLTLRENMIFQGLLYQMDTPAMQEKMNLLIDSFGLRDYTEKRVASYSGGIKRRLDIAMSMMSSPKILFLDEPTVGMDIESRHAMWDIVRKISLELQTTVFLTTHYLEEADKLSDTICIMQDGRQITQDTPDNLKRYTMRQQIRISCDTRQDSYLLADLLAREVFVHETFCSGRNLTVIVEDAHRDYAEISRLVWNSGIAQTGIEIVRPDLDDVFLAFTRERSV